MRTLRSFSALTLGVGVGLALSGCSQLDHDGASEAVVGSAWAAPSPTTISVPSTVSYAPLVEQLAPAVVNVNVEAEVENPLKGMEQNPFFRFFDVPQELREQYEQHGGTPLRHGQGSGFFISPDGYLITNNHVVESASGITITTSDEQTYEAEVVGTDPRIDIALLKVEGADFPHLRLGDSEGMRVGDHVLAIGNPFGLGHTVTAGIISAKGRALGSGPYDDFLQTDAAINPGNSGGPLFDLAGQVVGVNTAITAQGSGIAFSVPIDMVEEVLDDLKADGEVHRGWIGVSLQTLDEGLAAGLGLADVAGALVNEVHDGTPAAKAGLQAWDVIVSVDDEPIGSSDDLVQAIGRRRAGERIELAVIRDGDTERLSCKLGERPTEEAIAQGEYQGSPDATPEKQPDTARTLGIKLMDSPEGVVVVEVDPSGPAARVLRAGDRIVEVGRQPVTSARDAGKRLKADDTVLVVVDRQGRRVFVSLQKS